MNPRVAKTCRRSTIRIWLGRIVVLAVVMQGLASRAEAQSRFRELIQQLPSSTNAVVIVNVEKIKVSPMAVQQKWAEDLERSFRAGLSRIPPHATHMVIAAELDLEFLTPIWEAAVFDLDRAPSLEAIIRQYGGTTDTLDQLSAVALTTDAYVVQFAPQNLGVMRPANRQAALRWIREAKSNRPSRISSYIEKAAGYSDEAGTDIIMAIDLGGAISWERAAKYLKHHQELLKLDTEEIKRNATAISGVQGLRIGIRAGENLTSKLAIDFQQPVSFPPELAKKLVLEILADAGAKIEDLDQWVCQVKGTEIGLSGILSLEGLRKVASLIDSPAPSQSTVENKSPSTGGDDLPSKKTSASLAYFHAVTGMFEGLKKDWHSIETLACGAVYFDRYARRIEQLPMLNVDSDLLDYGQYVAREMRAAAGAVRTMGIRGGARQSQVSGYDAAPTVVGGGGGVGYGYGGYRAGWGYAEYYNPMDTIRQTSDARRKIRAEEKGTMATSVMGIRDQVIQATNQVRRAMTEKYQVEF